MSVIIPLLLFLLCAVGTLLLLRAYLPLRKTPEYVLFPIFLAIFIPCSIVLLVPIDLSSNSGEGDRGIVLGDRTLLVGWRIAYWLCFCLTWAFLPILQCYSDSGHRSPKARFIQALRENARYQAILLSVGLIGLVYVFFYAGFHFSSIYGLVIALSHCYALSLAIFLMGHGLVAIPKNLFKNADVAGNLKRLQTSAVGIHDNLADATAEVQELQVEVAILNRRKTGTAREFQEWIEVLAEAIGTPDQTGREVPGDRGRSPVPQVITEEYLAGLGRRVKFARYKQDRWKAAWEATVQAAAEDQAILDSVASKRLIFPTPFSTSRWKNSPFLNAYTRHILHLYIIPQLKRALAVIFSLASISLAWSEVVRAAFPKLSIVGYTVVHHPNSKEGTIGLAGQAIAAMWIAYMCACAFSSMRTIKVWGGHALVPRKTRAASACFYASYACRLTVPLAYNFGSFIPASTFKESTFFRFLGKSINLTPLGSGFNNIFPALVLIPVFASLFNLYGKVKEWVGLEDFIADDEDEENIFGAGGWREGRDLIDRELGGGIYGALSTTGVAGLREGASRARSTGNGGRSLGRASERTRITNNDDDSDDENVGMFSGFFQRVGNTFKTAPVFMHSSEDRPRWMQGGRSNAGRGGSGLPTARLGPGSSAGPSGNTSDGRSFLDRLFGGGGGSIRL